MGGLDQELVRQLEAAGLTVETSRVVALLPLVQVAWADGAVQPAERDLILKIAAKRGFASAESLVILERWLTVAPSRLVYLAGRKAVKLLVVRANIELPNLEEGTVAEVVAYCQGVAEAAGGLFGLGAVSGAERTMIAEIAQGLDVRSPKAWSAVKAELG